MTHRVLIVGSDLGWLTQIEAGLKRAQQAAMSFEDTARATLLCRQFQPTVVLFPETPESDACLEAIALLSTHPATSTLPKVAFDHGLPVDFAVDLLSRSVVDLPPVSRSGPELVDRLDRLFGVLENDPQRNLAFHRRNDVILRRICSFLARREASGRLQVSGHPEAGWIELQKGRISDARLGDRGGVAAVTDFLTASTEAVWTHVFDVAGDEQFVIEVEDELVIESTTQDIHAVPALLTDQRPTTPLKLLLCDDEEALHHMYTRFFEREGFITFSAENGHEGLEVALRERPDVIVSDIMMPGSDGWGLLTGVRDDFHLRETPFVLLSCHDDYLNRLAELSAGADDYLEKGLRLESIVERVQRVVSPRHALLRSIEAGLPQFGGRLSRLGPQYVIGALCQGHRSGTLRVDAGDGTFTVGLKGDLLWGATSRCGTWQSHGRDALLSLLALEDGTFSFVDGVPEVDGNVEISHRVALEELAEELNQNQRTVREVLMESNSPLTFDEARLELYQLVATDHVRPVLAALREGSSPQALLEGEELKPALVTSVTLDLLRKRIARFGDIAS